LLLLAVLVAMVLVPLTIIWVAVAGVGDGLTTIRVAVAGCVGCGGAIIDHE
jgi:hypothetical protein